MHVEIPKAGSRSQSSPKLLLPEQVSPGTPIQPTQVMPALKADLRWDVRKVRLREEIDYLLKTARSF